MILSTNSWKEISLSQILNSSYVYIKQLMNHAMNTASSPCPTQTSGKGPGHTCKNSRMRCASRLCLESPPITKFLTHDVVDSFKDHLKMGTRITVLLQTSNSKTWIIHTLARLLLLPQGFACIINSSWLPCDHVRHPIVT